MMLNCAALRCSALRNEDAVSTYLPFCQYTTDHLSVVVLGTLMRADQFRILMLKILAVLMLEMFAVVKLMNLRKHLYAGL
jgi:hypothetical protein